MHLFNFLAQLIQNLINKHKILHTIAKGKLTLNYIAEETVSYYMLC